ncbi:MAG: hypothetical protein HN685_01925, partial [Waddliaceae bacterium]|nr:hypothetical protein [Waddliaceae bacterium]
MFSKISLFFVVIALLCCFTGSAFAEESTDLSNDKYVEAVATMKDYSETLGWHGWLTILVLVATIAVLVSEKLPPDIVMLMGSGVLLFGGILTPTEFLTGFSKDVIFTLAMLFIIARALDTHGVISYLANKMFTKSKSYAKQLFSLMAPLSVGSAFLNNTPIVLMLTPVVRKWALDKKKYPSQFLIPLSYAAILGGSCTLIGTSSNLVVDGLLRAENPAAGFGFFELAKIGIPCVIVGIIYMMTFGRRLLPKRRDPTKNIAQEVKNFTGEFSVTKTCPLIAMTIAAASPQYFSGELLIEIERDGDIIASPGADEVIHDGDRLVFAGEICDIAKLHSIEGLNSLVDPHFTLDISSSHFSEVVISNTSSWIGKTLRKVRFRTYYGGSVLAIYREGKRVVGTVRGTKLRAGDVLIMLSNKPWPQDFDYNNDFFYIRHTEKLPLRVSRRAWWVFGVLVAMIMAATSGVPMFFASICAVVALTATKSIAIHEI